MTKEEYVRKKIEYSDVNFEEYKIMEIINKSIEESLSDKDINKLIELEIEEIKSKEIKTEELKIEKLSNGYVLINNLKIGYLDNDPLNNEMLTILTTAASIFDLNIAYFKKIKYKDQENILHFITEGNDTKNIKQLQSTENVDKDNLYKSLLDSFDYPDFKDEFFKRLIFSLTFEKIGRAHV